jgi:hypothetical protein
MTIQEKTAERVYEILPHKKGYVIHDTETRINSITGDLEEIKVDNGKRNEAIRLADILLAIGKEKLEWLYDEDTLVVLRLLTSYNLSKDNLLNQSSEFCEMILGLLDNK